MKIVQANLQTDYGGAERHVLLLARGLRERGHEVSLLCHPAASRFAREAAESLGEPAVRTVTARSQMDARAVIGLARRLRQIRPGVLHLHTPREYLSGAFAARLARLPVRPAVVATRHLLRPVKPIMRQVYRFGVDAVICPAAAVRAGLRDAGVPEHKLRHVPGAIDVRDWGTEEKTTQRDVIREEWGIGDVAVGVVGRLVAGKGQVYFLQAAARLRNEPHLTFFVVGDGPERDALQTLAEQLGLAGRVRFTGFRADMDAVMAALDVVCLTSMGTEVLPLTLLEAMASGRATVATNVSGGVAEVVENDVTGLLVPPGDADALCGALHALARDGALRARLAANGRAHVERYFSLGPMAEATERVYESLRGER